MFVRLSLIIPLSWCIFPSCMNHYEAEDFSTRVIASNNSEETNKVYVIDIDNFLGQTISPQISVIHFHYLPTWKTHLYILFEGTFVPKLLYLRGQDSAGFSQFLTIRLRIRMAWNIVHSHIPTNNWKSNQMKTENRVHS